LSKTALLCFYIQAMSDDASPALPCKADKDRFAPFSALGGVAEG